METFEDFLEAKFMDKFPQILDDDLPDAFNNYEWDTEELIEYGDEFNRKNIEKLIEEIPEDMRTFDKDGREANYLKLLKVQLKAKWLPKE